MFTMVSSPQRLHLIGRSLIFVVGSNHKTVCLPHDGQRKRCRSVLSIGGLSSTVFCKWCHLIPQPLHGTQNKQKSLCHNRIQRLNGTGSQAQAQIQFTNHYVNNTDSSLHKHKMIYFIIHGIYINVNLFENKKE